jgi:hypothetical protein
MLWLLRLLSRTSDARPAGDETVRGTPCRKLAVDPDELTSAWIDPELTVWIDEQYVRRIQLKQNMPWLYPADEPGDSAASACSGK